MANFFKSIRTNNYLEPEFDWKNNWKLWIGVCAIERIFPEISILSGHTNALVMNISVIGT